MIIVILSIKINKVLLTRAFRVMIKKSINKFFILEWKLTCFRCLIIAFKMPVSILQKRMGLKIIGQ